MECEHHWVRTHFASIWPLGLRASENSDLYLTVCINCGLVRVDQDELQKKLDIKKIKEEARWKGSK